MLEVRHPRASDLPRDPEAVGRGGPLQVPPDAGRQLLHAAGRLEGRDRQHPHRDQGARKGKRALFPGLPHRGVRGTRDISAKKIYYSSRKCRSPELGRAVHWIIFQLFIDDTI